MSKHALVLRVEAQREMTPAEGKGYNVVGLDTFEEPGDELYLISHHSSRADADAAAEKAKRGGHERVYVYGSEAAEVTSKSLVKGRTKDGHELLVYRPPRPINLEWK